MSKLSGKRFLVTGAGRGLGKEIARELLRLGAEVIASDRDGELVANTTAELFAGGGRIFAYPMDVGDLAAIRNCRERILAEHGPVDGIVNNAGVIFGGDFLAVPAEDHQRTFAINTTGTVNVTHTFLPDLISRPQSWLVNMVSASAVIALPFATTYAASKWAVLGFSESLREELRLLGHHHVRVTAICPSYIATGMFDGAKPAKGTWLLDPAKVAHAAVRAMLRGRQMVLLPWTVRLLYACAGWLPRGAFRWLCRQLGVSHSMAAWKGRSS